MEKVRIYELAKELNTTSKRLIEKLAEININVKNHMSYLEEKEVEALYKHIGLVAYDKDEGGKDKVEEKKKSSVPTAQAKNEPKKAETREQKNIPPSVTATGKYADRRDSTGYGRTDSSYRDDNVRRDKDSRRYGNIKVSVASSGLRAGFVRDTGPIIPTKKADKPATSTTVTSTTSTSSAAEKTTTAAEKPALDKAAHDKQNMQNMQNIKDKAKEEEKVKVEEKVRAADEKAKEKVIRESDKEKTAKQQDKPQDRQIDRQAEKPQHVSSEEVKKEDIKKADINKEEAKEAKKEEAKKEEMIKEEIKKDEAKKEEIKKEEVKKEEMKKEDIKKEEARKETENKQQEKKKEDKNIINIVNKEQESEIGVGSSKHHKHEGRRAGFFDMPEAGIDVDYDDYRYNDYRNKEIDKDKKREQKREMPRLQTSVARKKKIKTHELIIDGKKNISEVIKDDLLIDPFYDDHKIKKASKPAKQKKEDKNKNKDKTGSSEAASQESKQTASIPASVKIPERITVKEFAEILKKSSAEVIRKLMNLGIMVTVNQEIDFDTAAIIADEFGIQAEKEVEINVEDILFHEEPDKEEDLQPRPPVVVVMGHVDHGKTSLLDAIRKSNVTASEEGGITQHIGAYTVNINGRNITFLDTPGHEAFTALRARGAQVTDIAILVVAADDGVMPQTVEAINHAKAANVTIIVAINKIDKPGANPDRVKQQLTEYGLVPEEWGGDVVTVPISALKNQNIDLLLEMVLLTADLLELKANPKAKARGTIIESKLDKHRGAIATLLVQRGTLHVGDTIIAGTVMGKVRAMIDDKGKNIKSAGPSTPVEILGLSEVPESGETFYQVEDEKLAKSLVEKRKEKLREEQMKKFSSKISLDQLFNQIQEGNVKELNVIIKADTQGSVEALKQSIEKLSNDQVKISILHAAVGGITETDVKLADVSNAIIIGFNVRPEPNVSDLAKSANIDIRLYRIIYDAIDDIQAAMKGMLAPKIKEVVLGHAEIRQLFKVSNLGTIGGCYVLDGKITRNANVRVLRDSRIIYEGKLMSLKRFKDDVKEVMQGYECGVVIERFNDIKEGDIIESYVMEEVQE